MSSNSSSDSFRSGAQPTDSDTANDEGADVISPLPSSFLDELRDDDTTTVYTYYSTVSTNYTMSNLPGPGRLLGNFYSRAGRALEKRLRRGVTRAAIKEYEQAVHALKSGRAWGALVSSYSDPGEQERACDVLLTCARSDDVTIQIETFMEIVWCFVSSPSKFHSAFIILFARRNEIGDVITFSWKRPGVEYSFQWLFEYKLASRCLSSHHSSFFDATAHLDGVKSYSLDFSHFEGLLLNSGDTSDLLLALLLIDWYWNGKAVISRGIEDFMWSKECKPHALVQFANGLSTWWKVSFSALKLNGQDPLRANRLRLTNQLLEGVMRSYQKVDTDEPDGRSEYDARLAMWVDVFKLHQFLRRSEFEENSLVYKSWGDLCHESLTNPEHAKLRQSLLHLEDIYGPAMHKHFPPKKHSAIVREEKALAEATRPIAGLAPCTHCSDPWELDSDLRLRYWRNHSWYDHQLGICDEMMIVTGHAIFRTSSTGVPYTIKIGQAAPNACNVCYRASHRQWWHSRLVESYPPPSPIVVVFTYHRGIATFFILHVAVIDVGDDVLKPFEVGFRLHRKDMIHFTYEEPY